MKLAFTIITFILLSIFSNAQSDSVLYSFFVAGHSYGAPGINNEGLHPPFVNKFNYIKSRPEIEFGILTGDIVSSNPIVQDWEEVDADIDSLGLPVHFAVGNHDMENRPVFEDRYGSTYYNFIHNDDLFIILDPNLDGWSISGDQLQFLQDVILNNYMFTENVYVFFHQILWRDGTNQFNHITWNSSAGRMIPVNFWSEVVPLFDLIPNDVYMFAGDLGASWSTNVSYDRYLNITLIASGMGHEDGENFIVVNVANNKSLNYDLICLSDSNANCLGELTDYLTVDIEDGRLKQDGGFNPVIYPNPASSFFKVSSGQATTLQLFDISGALILETESDAKSIEKIDVSYLAKGVYIVKLNSDDKQSTQKLIIQ